MHALKNFSFDVKMRMITEREYRPIHWPGGFEYPGMVRIYTIADGSCFFHAIANSYFLPYRQGVLNGNRVSKRELVRSLRRDLAEKLASPVDPEDPNSPIHYDVLSRGRLREFAKGVPDYTLENMQRELDSCAPVDNVYNEFISNQLNKDIYLLDAETRDVRITGDDDDILYKGRPSIVILCLPGHYELVGIDNGELGIQTYFDPDHPFIQSIRDRMATLRKLRNRESNGSH